MKKLLLTLLAIALIFTACNKKVENGEEYKKLREIVGEMDAFKTLYQDVNDKSSFMVHSFKLKNVDDIKNKLIDFSNQNSYGAIAVGEEIYAAEGKGKDEIVGLFEDLLMRENIKTVEIEDELDTSTLIAVDAKTGDGIYAWVKKEGTIQKSEDLSKENDLLDVLGEYSELETIYEEKPKDKVAFGIYKLKVKDTNNIKSSDKFLDADEKDPSIDLILMLLSENDEKTKAVHEEVKEFAKGNIRVYSTGEKTYIVDLDTKEAIYAFISKESFYGE